MALFSRAIHVLDTVICINHDIIMKFGEDVKDFQ